MRERAIPTNCPHLSNSILLAVSGRYLEESLDEGLEGLLVEACSVEEDEGVARSPWGAGLVASSQHAERQARAEVNGMSCRSHEHAELAGRKQSD